jgi:phage-related protein
MDSFESQIRFGITLSNLTHNENDTTLHGNRFLKNLIDRAQIDTKKKATTNRTNNLTTNGKFQKPPPLWRTQIFQFFLLYTYN